MVEMKMERFERMHGQLSVAVTTDGDEEMSVDSFSPLPCRISPLYIDQKEQYIHPQKYRAEYIREYRLGEEKWPSSAQ